MSSNTNAVEGSVRARLIWLALLLFIAGCSSAKVAQPAEENHERQSRPPIHPSVDDSWTTEAYRHIGLPDPARFWTAADFRDCRDVLYSLDRTNRVALPRAGSPKSGVVFGRLTNPTNTLLLGDMHLPSRERIQHFMTILNRLPAFQDIYRPDARQPYFFRERIELDHTFLRVLGSAVEWDGKQLSPAPGESQPETFRLVEVSRSYRDSLVNRSPADNVIPRGDRLVIVGAHTLATLSNLLPWLADGSGLSDADRLLVLRYYQQDTPVLWPHLSVSQQREVLETLDVVLKRTAPGEIRRHIEAFHQTLIAGATTTGH